MFLESIIFPLPLEGFLQSVFDNRHLHSPKGGERLTREVTWDWINQQLRYHALPAGCFELWKNGSRINPPASNRRSLAFEVTQHLREGATLILQDLDQMSVLFQEIAAEILGCLGTVATIDLCAIWEVYSKRAQPVLNQHTILVQLYGSEEWHLASTLMDQGTGSELPRLSNASVPSELVEVNLAPGDTLYIPSHYRTWSSAPGGPTAHVRIRIPRVAGADFVDWLCKRVSGLHQMQKKLPAVADVDSMTRFRKEVRRALLEIVDDPQSIDDFNSYRRASRLTLADPGLPWSADTERCLPCGQQFLIDSLVIGDILIQPDQLCSDWINVMCNGRVLTFPAAARRIIEFVTRDEELLSRDLCAKYAGAHTEEQIYALLGDLAAEGVIRCRAISSSL